MRFARLMAVIVNSAGPKTPVEPQDFMPEYPEIGTREEEPPPPEDTAAILRGWASAFGGEIIEGEVVE